ncbi:MAG: GIY-YIG nuclease family protein [Candidatus Omnitrophota bacterium]
MNYVYVIYSASEDRFYIGYTKDIKRRIAEHEAGRNHTTSRYAQRKVIFYEAFFTESDARRREEYFKTTKGRKALRIMLRDTLDNKSS